MKKGNVKRRGKRDRENQSGPVSYLKRLYDKKGLYKKEEKMIDQGPPFRQWNLSKTTSESKIERLLHRLVSSPRHLPRIIETIFQKKNNM